MLVTHHLVVDFTAHDTHWGLTVMASQVFTQDKGTFSPQGWGGGMMGPSSSKGLWLPWKQVAGEDRP